LAERTVGTPRIKSTAILIGYNDEDRCVYSEIIDIHDYYDGEHVWDEPASVKRLKLQMVRGYLFDSSGVLTQEFESIFDITTGMYSQGRVRYPDGTEHKDTVDA
jgi:hypothetical protein